jgi:hypothetical protein
MELFTAPPADELSALLEQINVRSVVYCLWAYRARRSPLGSVTWSASRR